MTDLDKAIADYIDCKHRLEAVQAELDGHKAVLVDLVGEGGAHTTPAGVKVKVTPAATSQRFDWKRYLVDHPGAKRGYMVETKRKPILYVTEPKQEELDEYGWEA